ncbi:MAG: 3-deoxy-manno-octulosonate cytidylyltransferase [Limnohabitans sp.]
MVESVPFSVIIPARMASSRLPDKPLADIGGLPMVVRVAQRASQSAARQVVVATDDDRVLQACQQQGVRALITRKDHPSGSDRLAEAAELMGLEDAELVVNVQGDEPLIDPWLINAVSAQLNRVPQASMSTAAHPVDSMEDYLNPNVVKVVLNARSLALYFSRAPIAWWRDGHVGHGFRSLPSPVPLRHIGLYAYRAGFLRLFPRLPPAPLETLESLEQLRALWHGYMIAVHTTARAPGPGVDTPEDLERVRQLFAMSGA